MGALLSLSRSVVVVGFAISSRVLFFGRYSPYSAGARDPRREHTLPGSTLRDLNEGLRPKKRQRLDRSDVKRINVAIDMLRERAARDLAKAQGSLPPLWV